MGPEFSKLDFTRFPLGFVLLPTSGCHALFSIFLESEISNYKKCYLTSAREIFWHFPFRICSKINEEERLSDISNHYLLTRGNWKSAGPSKIITFQKVQTKVDVLNCKLSFMWTFAVGLIFTSNFDSNIKAIRFCLWSPGDSLGKCTKQRN